VQSLGACGRCCSPTPQSGGQSQQSKAAVIKPIRQPMNSAFIIPTVRLGYVETKNFRVLSFSLGAAVLDSEFRADPESGLRIEQSPAGHIESSVLKSADFST
jgi:hypothetical protein